MTTTCDIEMHEATKQNRERYVAATQFFAWQEDCDGPPLEFRNCLVCGSTLCDGTRQDCASVEAASVSAGTARR